MDDEDVQFFRRIVVIPIPIPNIVIFGESSVGKSSVVNLIAGADVALTHPPLHADRCNLRNTPYEVEFSGSKYRLYDTPALDENSPATDVAMDLYKLVLSLHEGINLLALVIRGPRVTQSILPNYEMFYKIICQKKVPILLIVTGLEVESPMDEWWGRNKCIFAQHGMLFTNVACITASKGKLSDGAFLFQQEYDESMVRVRECLRRSVLPVPVLPWRVDPLLLLVRCVRSWGYSRWKAAAMVNKALKGFLK